ncbi:MAG: Eco57I restriction-modification methylase domain-containing protein [Candidatus Heimdallarchaeaceae archaeon]
MGDTTEELISILRKKFADCFEKEKMDDKALKSLILKSFLLWKNDFFNINEEKHNFISLQNIIRNVDDNVAELSILIEKIPVVHITLPVKLFKTIELHFRKNNHNDLLNLIRGEKRKKGQYFTHPTIVKKIISELRIQELSTQGKKITVLDFSSGVGDFILPLLHQNNLICYSVELDELVYEYQVFQILFNSEFSFQTKLKLPLITQLGDSLKGYQKEIAEKVLTDKTSRDILLEYRNQREKILFQRDQSNLENTKNVLKLKNKLSELKGCYTAFNWFIDFPEIFLDEHGDFKRKTGFEVVVGNPPWKEYSKDLKTEYNNILSNSLFSSQLYGKYNFALTFAILAGELFINRLGLVLPSGLLTDTYGHLWRKKLAERKIITSIQLLQRKWFSDINNEYCLLFLDSNVNKNSFVFYDSNNDSRLEVLFSSLNPPLYQLPLMQTYIQETIEKIRESFPKLSEFCIIRRGLTLTSTYQKKYMSTGKINKKTDVRLKRLIKNNINLTDQKEGVFNFQVWYNHRTFVYDKTLLGAAGTETLFEQPKIIRRNRGKDFIIGLDREGVYVNDIFDIIIPKVNKISLLGLFGYLCSSFTQFLIENYLQRDITSNRIRLTPVPTLDSTIWYKLEELTKLWLGSSKDQNSIIEFRREIDRLVYNYFKIPANVQKEMEKKVSLHWNECFTQEL